MIKQLLAALGTTAVLALSGMPAMANNGQAHINYARVTYVEPIYRYVTIRKPKRHCSYVKGPRHQNRHRQARRFVSGESYRGNRNSRRESRISTGTQGLRGNRHNQVLSSGRHHKPRRHCVTTRVAHRERRFDGYNVTYVYRGNTYQTRTDHHPGDRIRVKVEVRPH